MADKKRDTAAIDQLKSAQSEILTTIEEMKEIGVHWQFEIPQIVCCSCADEAEETTILELTTGISAPLRSKSIAPLTIEFVLCRKSCSSLTATLLFSAPAAETTISRSHKFSPGKLLHEGGLSELFDEVATRISSGEKAVIGDILRIEICGPEHPDIVLVDLPTMRTRDGELQNIGDTALRAIKSYFECPNHLLLAIIPISANKCDLDSITSVIKRFDPEYQRSLKIVTFRQNVMPPGEEDEESQFIRDNGAALKTRWHAVDLDLSGTPGILAGVSRGCTGTENLRNRISNWILEQVKCTIPDLVKRANEVLSDYRTKLENLGKARPTMEEKRGHLVQIACRFEVAIKQTLDGTYNDGFFNYMSDRPASNPRQLRLLMKELHWEFVKTLQVGGSRRQITSYDGELVNTDLDCISTNRYLQSWSPNPVNREDLEKEIQQHAQYRQGLDLQQLVGGLLRDQMKPWEEISQKHLRTAWELVNRFLYLLVDDVADEYTSRSICKQIVEPVMEGIKEGLQRKLEELSFFKQKNYPILHEICLFDLMNQAGNLEANGPVALCGGSPSTEPSVHKRAESKIIDLMERYYDEALTVFTENIVMLAIENCLLTPLETIFNGNMVCEMDTEQVVHLASEPASVQQDREVLQNNIERLQTCLKTCSRYDNSNRLLRQHHNISKQELAPAASLGRSATYPGIFTAIQSVQQVQNDSAQKRPTTSIPPSAMSPGKKRQTIANSSGNGFASGSTQKSSAFSTPSVLSNGSSPNNQFGVGTGSGSTGLFSSISGQHPSQLFSSAASNSQAPWPSVFSETTRTSESLNVASAPLVSGQPSTPGTANFDVAKFGSEEGYCFRNELGDLNVMHSICAFEVFRPYSFEELRLADYERGYVRASLS